MRGSRFLTATWFPLAQTRDETEISSIFLNVEHLDHPNADRQYVQATVSAPWVDRPPQAPAPERSEVSGASLVFRYSAASR